MNSKPEGPIWVDMTETLMELSVNKLVLIANLSLNKLSVRDIGEVCFHAELDVDIKLCEK
jgi:hypothetical protein